MLAVIVLAVGAGWIAISVIHGHKSHHLSVDIGTDGKVVGSGKRIEATRQLADVRVIEIEGAFHANIAIGEGSEIRIAADDNLVPLITTEVDDGTLTVKRSKSFTTDHPPQLTITVPRLEELRLDSSKVAISGLKGEKFKLSIDGASDVTASGTVDKALIDIDGAAHLALKNLATEDMILKMDGSGIANVTATRSLDVAIDGAGSVTYFGAPGEVKKVVDGVGKIEAAG
jgi:hypothetical protein